MTRDESQSRQDDTGMQDAQAEDYDRDARERMTEDNTTDTDDSVL